LFSTEFFSALFTVMARGKFTTRRTWTATGLEMTEGKRKPSTLPIQFAKTALIALIVASTLSRYTSGNWGKRMKAISNYQLPITHRVKNL
jgi:hypothetical protein